MSRLPALPGFCLALLPAFSHAALPGWIPSEWLAPTPYPALLLLGLPAAGLLLWVWRLRRRRRQRLATLEQSLRSAAQHYHGLMAQLPLISWEMRLSDLRFTHVSPQAAALLGYPVDAWLEADFYSRTLYPADAAAALALLQGDGDAQARLEHRLIAADGRPVWVLAIVQRLPNGDDSLLQGLFIDIAQSKQIEQALRLSEQKFSSAFQHSPDIMLLLERDSGRILTANRAFEQASGLSADAVCGRTTSELGLWCRHEQGLQVLQQLQTHDLQNIEVSLLRHGKEAFTGLLSARRIELDGQPAAIVVLRDLADLQQTRQQLHSSEEKFAKVFHASPDALSITRLRDGLLLEANPGFTQITGYSPSEAVNRTALELGLWVDQADRQRLMRTLEHDGCVQHMPAWIRTSDGRQRLCELSAQPLQIDDEDCVLIIAHDISERMQMQERLLQAATVFESTAEGVMITDLDQRIVAINRAFSAITGYSESEALGQTPQLLASGQHGQEFHEGIVASLERDGHWQGEIWNRRKNGESYPAWMTISAVRNGGNRISHHVAVFADITSLKHAQARLDYQAHHDPLTGLPNRLLFENRLQQALDEAQAEQRRLAVLFLDLDRFKHINDSLGHPVGDLLLQGIAKRLREQLREIDTVARLGGDEFIVLMPTLQQTSDVERVANKLMSAFATPFNAGGHEFFMSSSMGISLFPEHGEDVATLVKNADSAMYKAKARGRNRIEFYTADLSFQATERMALENDLRRAAERGELHLYYQPKRCLSTDQLVGAEALLRWRHPLHGDVPPERFIALAEENGSILELGDWVLQEACRQLSSWQKDYAPFGPLALNLAGAQLRQPQLVGRISELLANAGLKPGCLQLEITETFVMSQKEEALPILQALKELGLQLAIDDFGTGYSSLSYLKRLPVDILKIDQSFIAGLPADPDDAAITRAIIALGRSMQLTVIAEGVETKSQERFLAIEGCQQIQGYVLSKPLPAEEFAAKFLKLRQAVGVGAQAPL
ncbi:PAS domain S-box-containing protein/diguanylate cyclase (GGDEF) domain-containing protein [Geopseudomonas sagittaria]|uniref:cyclic-guanylate-specific phosphodiesterase n=1 Tax=Geopseudomonas sagittaria TaxID=1135990 RepID=A0A1I5UD21_9GAMM|nr:PAS domain S-box-containing protein/diguanylate cyclase (GGDEF) domain-containing protein [Pseudomonas sagittaria]